MPAKAAGQRKRKAQGGKHLDGACMALGRDRKCRNRPRSSPGPSGASPWPQEEENEDPSHLAGNKSEQLQLALRRMNVENPLGGGWWGGGGGVGNLHPT